MLAVAIAMLFVPLLAGPASAAPPSNDHFAGAIPISLGFEGSQVTTEATTDAEDEEMSDLCTPPGLEASVWYSYTPAESGLIGLNGAGSSYPVGFILATGSPGSFALAGCGPAPAVFSATAGQTYAILVVDSEPGVTNGGLLNLQLVGPPPAPTAALTVDQARANRDGSATVSGTYTCTEAFAVSIAGQVTQPVGRFTITGQFFFDESLNCDGTAHPWSAVTGQQNGRFAGGRAAVDATMFACGTTCSQDQVEVTLKLRAGPK
ncbi:MAG: DUF6299 family protein [Acidimicrobiales bacterium]